MAADAHLIIEIVSPEGEPTHPRQNASTFVTQCGVLVRDCIPITVQEWHKPRHREVSYVGDAFKEMLWKKLMVNFLLPVPVVNPDEEERAIEELLKKVKKWALQKMAELFKNWKNKLNTKFISKGKTPDFKDGTYQKIKDDWDEFVA